MNRASRRQFLKGLGGVTVALPFLPSLMPREAWANPYVAPKRFVAVHNGHCQAVEQWLPDPTKVNFTQQDSFARSAPLSSISGVISPVLGSAFDNLRNKLFLLGRLDPLSATPNHNAEVILSGGVKSEFSNTLDQVLAGKLTGGSPTNLYVRSVFDTNYSGASQVSVANGNYSLGQFNPSAVFAAMFGSGAVATPMANSGPDPKSVRNASVLDLVYRNYASLRANKQLSKSDAQRLDQHLSEIAQKEAKIKSTLMSPMGGGTSGLAMCSSPKAIQNSPVASSNEADYGVVLDQMFDVIELGLKCGKIQVATLMMHVYDYFAGNIGFIPGVTDGQNLHTDVGHATSDALRAQKLALNNWYGQRVARFLTNMNVIEDPVSGSTFLDNSLILWANDQGAVNNASAHQSVNLPVLLAGSAGGFLKPGKFIDYGPAYSGLTKPVGGDDYSNYKKGRPYNQLLITILQAMGLSPSDYETGGTQGFGVYGGHTADYNYLSGNHRRDLLPLMQG